MVSKQKRPFVQRLRENPQAVADEIFKGLPADALSAITAELNPVTHERRLRRWIRQTAASAPGDDAMQASMREFEACLEHMDALDDQQALAALGAIEAAFAVAALAPPGERLVSEIRRRAIRDKQKASATAPRGAAKSPFTEFISQRLRRQPDASAKDIEKALVDEATNSYRGCGFKLTQDGNTLMHDESGRSLKLSSIPATVSSVRKELARK